MDLVGLFVLWGFVFCCVRGVFGEDGCLFGCC